jgi:hypothetical protein
MQQAMNGSDLDLLDASTKIRLWHRTHRRVRLTRLARLKSRRIRFTFLPRSQLAFRFWH